MVNEHLVVDMLLTIHEIKAINIGIRMRAIEKKPDVVSQQATVQ